MLTVIADDLLEVFFERVRDGCSRRALEFERVNGCAVFPDAEVEVGTGGVARRAYITYDLSLLDALAYLDIFGVAVEMEISSSISGIVFDFDGVTSPTLIGFEGNYPIADRDNGCTFGRGIIDTGMGSDGFEDGVLARIGEMGGYTAVVKRCFEESLAQALAFAVEVAADVGVMILERVGCLIEEGFLPMTRVVEIGGKDLSDPVWNRVHVLHFVENADGVTFLQTEEVNGPRVDVTKPKDKFNGEVLRGEGLP